MGGKELQAQLEDELAGLFQSDGKKLTDEVLRRDAPLASHALAPGSDAGIVGLLRAMTVGSQNEDLQALGVAMALDPRFPQPGIDHRFGQFVAGLGRRSDRSGRRRANKGVLLLAKTLAAEHMYDWYGQIDMSLLADPARVIVFAKVDPLTWHGAQKLVKPKSPRPKRMLLLRSGDDDPYVFDFASDNTGKKGQTFDLPPAGDFLRLDLMWDDPMLIGFGTTSDIGHVHVNLVRGRGNHALLLLGQFGEGAGRA